MKKIFLLATMAILMSSTVALANGDKNKNKNGKAKTEKCCTKTCNKPAKPCCDKSKCEKS